MVYTLADCRNDCERKLKQKQTSPKAEKGGGEKTNSCATNSHIHTLSHKHGVFKRAARRQLQMAKGNFT